MLDEGELKMKKRERKREKKGKEKINTNFEDVNKKLVLLCKPEVAFGPINIGINSRRHRKTGDFP